MIHGKNLVIKLGNEAIAASNSCDVDYDVENIEVASNTTGIVKKYIPKRESWSMTVAGLLVVGTIEDVLAKIRSQRTATLTAQFTDGHVTYSGNVLIKKFKFSGKVGSLSKYSISFQGSEELTHL